ncbi:MAG: HesA/MoeB/ThiF family protein [Thermoplasmatota archaeon]
MLSERQRKRYARQTAMSCLGDEGQEKLLEGTVAVVGLGGLGTAASLYLAAAGVGRLVLVDDDTVELSNLNRQVLYGDADIGHPKVERAAEALGRLNPDVEVTLRRERLGEDNAGELLPDADVALDCLDGFAARYILNDAAIRLRLPLVHGAVGELHGQVLTIMPGSSACLRCVFPCPPPERQTPVLGSVAGTIGTVQATETVKILAGVAPLLVGRLFVYDAGCLDADHVAVKRDPGCPACGGLP